MATQPHTKRIWVPSCQPRRSVAPSEARATITCRVCQAREDVALDNAVLLCRSCRSDPSGALSRLEAQTAAAESQLDAAGAQFQLALAAAHPRDQERYIRVVVTMADALSLRAERPSLQRVLRALARAGAAGDGLVALLAAEAQLREMVAWVQATYTQIQIAREECLLALDREQAQEPNQAEAGNGAHISRTPTTRKDNRDD